MCKAGLDWAAIAAVWGLPDADAAEHRYAKLADRRDAPVDEVPPLRLPALGGRTREATIGPESAEDS